MDITAVRGESGQKVALNLVKAGGGTFQPNEINTAEAITVTLYRNQDGLRDSLASNATDKAVLLRGKPDMDTYAVAQNIVIDGEQMAITSVTADNSQVNVDRADGSTPLKSHRRGATVRQVIEQSGTACVYDTQRRALVMTIEPEFTERSGTFRVQVQLTVTNPQTEEPEIYICDRASDGPIRLKVREAT